MLTLIVEMLVEPGDPLSKWARVARVSNANDVTARETAHGILLGLAGQGGSGRVIDPDGEVVEELVQQGKL